MVGYTPHQIRYFAEQVTLKRPQSDIDSIASALSGVKVDLNPHQVDAALFALKSPLSSGVLLADEVGLGKTIEAGLVLAQYWSERRRRILLVVPASLRTQWRAELEDKFYIKSAILESSSYNKAKKQGVASPFRIEDNIVICSFNFIAQKKDEVREIPWDLVIIDEAHRLRNVYKPGNVTAVKIKEALAGRRKLLLTATPLQNNLMELYGLVSIIDERVFGDSRTFRDMYLLAANEEVRNRNLKTRLRQFCKRTLRKQVTEYVSYTSRIPILQEYEPTDKEEMLYNLVSSYLQTDVLFALPQSQRNLITLVLRKLLASSSFAILGTLTSLIARLDSRLSSNKDTPLNLEDDYDRYSELTEESDEETLTSFDSIEDKKGIAEELTKLKDYAALAKSITNNSKGDNLLLALEKGFDATEARGGQRKAVIFTESRRTQEYLLNLLSNNGYEDSIVFLNGTNDDEISKKIYTRWKARHKKDGTESGSRQADMKTAVVEEFRDRANILIGTEAAAEGINLQFCSLIVNYDLPWNPQRIEQRIGRCHRYGQKNDVVVVNFLNKKNAADVRVYELLEKKFKLFDGLFGSSDEVLGSVESGIDFEKRISTIYQTCKTTEEIKNEFDSLQEELSGRISEKMTCARTSILENFDDEVAALLEDCNSRALAGLDRFSRWMRGFFVTQGARPLDCDVIHRLCYKDDVYNLKWKDAEKNGDIFLRRDMPMFSKMLAKALKMPLPLVNIHFNYSGAREMGGTKISFLENQGITRGVLSLDKLIYSGISEKQHLLLSAVTDDGVALSSEMTERILELPAVVTGDAEISALAYDVLSNLRNDGLTGEKDRTEQENKEFFLTECEKLDAYSEDLKEGLQRSLKDLKKLIAEKRKIFKQSTDRSLQEMLDMKEEINRLDARRKKMQREIYDEEDRIELENEMLQKDIRARLNGVFTQETIMTLSFEVV